MTQNAGPSQRTERRAHPAPSRRLSPKAGFTHAGGDAVEQSPEEELVEFLEPLPIYQQKVLWYTSNMSQEELLDWMHSIGPFSESQIRAIQAKIKWQPHSQTFDEVNLRLEFEQILQGIPAEWKRYRKNAKAEHEKLAQMMIPTPRGKPGRKPNDKVAARVWALKATGKSSREIQKALGAEGLNLSLSGVESYLKGRRLGVSRPSPRGK
jgi:hypothetical protein